MKILDVTEIYSDKHTVTITLRSGSVIHLPVNSQHSITILDMPEPADDYRINLQIDFYDL